MKEVPQTPESIFTKSVMIAGAGLAISEIFIGQRDPTLDLIAFVTIANASGVPVTPILETVKEKIDRIFKNK